MPNSRIFMNTVFVVFLVVVCGFIIFHLTYCNCISRNILEDNEVGRIVLFSNNLKLCSISDKSEIDEFVRIFNNSSYELNLRPDNVKTEQHYLSGAFYGKDTSVSLHKHFTFIFNKTGYYFNYHHNGLLKQCNLRNVELYYYLNSKLSNLSIEPN
jgi:hypothetical protein